MSHDIEHLLHDWDFEPDQLQVRIITGNDGKEKIQMRIDLGLIQMEFSGRPDGTRPRDMSRCSNSMSRVPSERSRRTFRFLSRRTNVRG